MSAVSHTPGPWRVSGKATINGKNGWIASVSTFNREANARLIAAAPDLLEALVAMQEAYFDFHDANGLTQPITGRANNAMELSIAAIAKARGDA